MSYSSVSFPFANELGCPLLENIVNCAALVRFCSLPGVAVCLNTAGLVFLSFKNTHNFSLHSSLNRRCGCTWRKSPWIRKPEPIAVLFWHRLRSAALLANGCTASFTAKLLGTFLEAAETQPAESLHFCKKSFSSLSE